MIEKEDEAKKQEVIQRRAANAPAPGAKPKRNPKAASPGGTGSPAADGDADASGSTTTESDVADSPAADASEGPSNRTPRPGARPKKRKR
jgi:YidC/Oxa1 family membrane protein insertase